MFIMLFVISLSFKLDHCGNVLQRESKKNKTPNSKLVNIFAKYR